LEEEEHCSLLDCVTVLTQAAMWEFLEDSPDALPATFLYMPCCPTYCPILPDYYHYLHTIVIVRLLVKMFEGIPTDGGGGASRSDVR